MKYFHPPYHKMLAARGFASAKNSKGGLIGWLWWALKGEKIYSFAFESNLHLIRWTGIHPGTRFASYWFVPWWVRTKFPDAEMLLEFTACSHMRRTFKWCDAPLGFSHPGGWSHNKGPDCRAASLRLKPDDQFNWRLQLHQNRHRAVISTQAFNGN